jgi:hypothetical protein
LKAKALAAVGVRGRIADVARDLDRLGVSLQRQLARDGHIVARAADLARLEAQLRKALGVEELRALQVSCEVGILYLDAADPGGAAQDAVAEACVEVGEGALEGSRHVGDGKADGGVNGVGAPGAGRQ